MKGTMRFTVLAVGMLAAAAPAAAQEPSARSMRRVMVRLADTEQEVKGRLIAIGPDTLTLLADGRRVELSLGRVVRVQTAKDPLWNGAVIGGLISGVWCAWVCGQGLSGPGQYVPAVAVAAGVGAAIGAGIDAGHASQVTLYSKPVARLPVVGRGRVPCFQSACVSDRARPAGCP